MELSLEPNGSNIKVVWHTGNWYSKPFIVPASFVHRRGAAVRDWLNELNLYMRKNPRLTLDRDPEWREYKTILGHLKEEGRSLYRGLFQPAEPSPTAEWVESEIRKLGPEEELRVHWSDETLTLPLGFIADPEREPARAVADPAPSRADFDDCWINRFDITAYIAGSRCDSLRIERDSFRTLYALHKPELEKAIEQLYEDAQEDEVRRLDTLRQVDVGEYNKWDLVRAGCASIAEWNSVVFIFAHAEDGEKLHLNTDSSVDCIAFAKLLQKGRRHDRAELLILNCCASAIGGEGRSLLSAVTQPGFCGLIGTEANILNTSALRCGIRLMWAMCFEGKSLGEAFKAMQKAPDLFPQNLFYTCYAARAFQLDTPLDIRSNREQASVAIANLA